MNVDAIGAIGAVDPTLLAPTQAAGAPPAAGFAQWFAQEAGHVNSAVLKAQEGGQQIATGQATSLHEVMIQMEEAKLSFQLLAQVRTRVLEAYQEIMRTQI